MAERRQALSGVDAVDEGLDYARRGSTTDGVENLEVLGRAVDVVRHLHMLGTGGKVGLNERTSEGVIWAGWQRRRCDARGGRHHVEKHEGTAAGNLGGDELRSAEA